MRTRDLKEQIELDVRLALDESAFGGGAGEGRPREGLELAENELAQARRRYEAGVAESVEVTDAQTRLERARDNQIAALYNYNLARLDLAHGHGNHRRVREPMKKRAHHHSVLIAAVAGGYLLVHGCVQPAQGNRILVSGNMELTESTSPSRPPGA